jgi:hypothetical protein
VRQGHIGTGDLSREFLELSLRFRKMNSNGNVDGTGKRVKFETARGNLFAGV